jgi:hypothetical protein
MFSYLEGEVPAELAADLSDETLVTAARLIRRFHDATAGSPLAGEHETVCHYDLSPCNFVFRRGLPLAIIDFDAAAPAAASKTSAMRVPGPKPARFASTDRCGGLANFRAGALVGTRQVDVNGCAAFAREEADAPSHSLSQLASDVKAEARPADATSLCWVEAEELLEDSVAVGVGDARSVIRDGEPDHELPFGCGQPHGSGGVLERVVDEVRDDLA